MKHLCHLQPSLKGNMTPRFLSVIYLHSCHIRRNNIRSRVKERKQQLQLGLQNSQRSHLSVFEMLPPLPLPVGTAFAERRFPLTSRSGSRLGDPAGETVHKRHKDTKVRTDNEVRNSPRSRPAGAPAALTVTAPSA